MIKVRYQTKSKMWLEFDVADTKEAVHTLSDLQSVFDECECGRCGSTNLRYRCNENKGFTFYSVGCQNPDCRARLEFGQRKEDGQLFPRLKDKDGQWLGHRGWVIFQAGDSHDTREF